MRPEDTQACKGNPEMGTPFDPVAEVARKIKALTYDEMMEVAQSMTDRLDGMEHMTGQNFAAVLSDWADDAIDAED